MNHNPADPLSGGHGHDSVGMHTGMPNGGPPGGPPSQNNPGGPGGGVGGGGGGGNVGGGGGGGVGPGQGVPGMIGPGCVPVGGIALSVGGGGGLGLGGPGGIIGAMPLNGGQVRICGGCGAKIIDRYLLHALDRFWHISCLKCSCCGTTLADVGSSCFTKGGMILCKNDYVRIFGSSGACTLCGETIPASEFVMRAQGNVYHLKCFACCKCRIQLVPGDRYNVVNGNLFCEQDCQKMMKSAISTGPPGRKGKLNRQEARQNKMAKATAMCQNMDLNQGAYI